MQDLTRHFRKTHWEFLRQLAEDCRAAGGSACLVGGCVRSALLGEEVNDFDVEVFGLEPDKLEPVLAAHAQVTRVGKAYGIYKLSGWPVDVGLPRTERKTGQGHRGFEVDIRPSMSIEEAARRRDFTVNAIYYDIAEGNLLDPLDGITDLRKRILRHCSDRFAEDPLRVLRAMQFAARIPADVAPETVELCRRLAPEGLSRERYFMEWEKLILLGKEPSRGLAFLRESDWVRWLPPLAALIGCPQDPRWHPEGDVWTHTLHCMDAFTGLRTGDREEDLVVGLAVLCHDFGKPLTTRTEDKGISSHGHEAAGIKPTREFLQSLNVPARIVEQVLPLVRCHMRPANLYRDRSSGAAVRRLARDCHRIDRLLKVVQADAAGRPPAPADIRPAIEWIREQAQRLEVTDSAPRPLLSGKDLLLRGWESGPAMGDFLDRAYEAQLDGAFCDRESALAWLDHQCAG